VTSETEGASDRIARFAAGSGRWLVSVLMISEGVDVPRLRVGVYATTARTELFFRQVVGRFVRRTPTPREQMSHLFLASDPRLKQLAAQIEEERNHALEQQAEGEAVAEQRERAEAQDAWRMLSSSARRDEDVLRTTQPGEALQLFADASAPVAPTVTVTTAVVPESRHDRREQLRDERRALVAAVSRRTGEPHRAIHGRINRETGAGSITSASVEQLERGNRILERQARRR
jgi:superfamily II DNA or RNA helicase